MKNENEPRYEPGSPQEAFDLLVKQDAYYEKFPLYVRGNSDRLFKASNLPIGE